MIESTILTKRQSESIEEKLMISVAVDRQPDFKQV